METKSQSGGEKISQGSLNLDKKKWNEILEASKKKGKENEISKKTCYAVTSGYCHEILHKKDACCRRCQRTTMLTIDHIIPKMILQSFMDIEREPFLENYQVLCRPCNQLKSGYLDFSIPETKTLLTKLLERV